MSIYESGDSHFVFPLSNEIRSKLNLSDRDHPELVARKAVWSPQSELHLRGTNEENKENSQL